MRTIVGFGGGLSLLVCLACGGGTATGGAEGPVMEYTQWRHEDGDVYDFRPDGVVHRDAGRGTFQYGNDGTWTQEGSDLHIVWAPEDEEDVHIVDACSALWMQSFGDETAVRIFPLGCLED